MKPALSEPGLRFLLAEYDQRVADLLPLAQVGLAIADACKAGSRHFHITDTGLATDPGTTRVRALLTSTPERS